MLVLLYSRFVFGRDRDGAARPRPRSRRETRNFVAIAALGGFTTSTLLTLMVPVSFTYIILNK
ncbi:hypothetical protein [Phormidium sp. FACHB-77]|uniref:hypothetical protein n=1 Tax=Cyanophyceae TaxID=3028117 RepID=UPI00168311A2|nr:hypothetical protein [Phormidium sp. FACHB-77]